MPRAGGEADNGVRPTPLMATLWPLELLLPIACARRRLVIGSSRPAFLGPCQDEPAPLGPAGEADLIVVAPSAAERRDEGFARLVVKTLAAQLAPDGLAYLLATRRWRARLGRSLSEAGLVVGPDFLHLPPRTRDQYLVSAHGSALTTALELMSPSTTLRRAAAALIGAPRLGTRVLRLLAECGTTIRRPNARPLLAWLKGVAPCPADSVVLRTKWRAWGGIGNLHVTSPASGHPSFLAKFALSDTLCCRTRTEAGMLERLGPSAARAGARIPTGQLLETPEGWPVLVERHLQGRRASSLIRQGSVSPIAVLHEVGTWLTAWHRATAEPETLTSERWDSELTRYAEVLAPHLKAGPAYLSWLSDQASGLRGRPLAHVAAHGDLTMDNILLGAGPLAIIDWEFAHPSALPMADFFYAAVDAVAAGGRTDVLEAFKATFEGGGSVQQAVRGHTRALLQAAGADRTVLPVCFHGCWLRHAANELQKKPDASSKPFLAIVDWIAAHPTMAETLAA